jgi:hypothetical protein
MMRRYWPVLMILGAVLLLVAPSKPIHPTTSLRSTTPELCSPMPRELAPEEISWVITRTTPENSTGSC